MINSLNTNHYTEISVKMTFSERKKLAKIRYVHVRSTVCLYHVSLILLLSTADIFCPTDMLFDSTDALRSKLSKLRLRDPNDRIDATTSLFHDYHDPEINRLFASSPPAPDEMVSYNFDRDKMKKVIHLSSLRYQSLVTARLCLQDQYKESMRGDISSHSKEEEEINVPEVPVDPDMSAPFEYLIRSRAFICTCTDRVAVEI